MNITMKKNLKINLKKNLKANLLAFASFSGVLCLGLGLSGCASTFENHENDYMRQSISARPAPVTPAGLEPIKTQPVFVIPPGPASYPAQKSNVNLKPPTLNN